MHKRAIIKDKDLEIEMMHILLYTTKSISQLLECKNELRKDTLDMCEKIQFEQRIANLFSVLYACKNSRLFKRSEQVVLFIDLLSKHFFESLQNSITLYSNRCQIENRLTFYCDLLEKINYGNPSAVEQSIFQLEKFYEKNIGIDETDQEIQDRISEDSTGNSTWYAYIYMQHFSANEILNKYESVDFS